jgi:predicted LPLAT superfamily acyltransferase
MTANGRAPRNPGPSWGYHFLTTLDGILPYPLMRAALRFGSLFALPGMPAQRAASEQYLQALGVEQPGWRQVHRHFAALTESLWLKLRAGRGRTLRFRAVPGPHTEAFLDFVRTDEPGIFGSMHLGTSDLLGCFLSDFDRRISMVRLRVGNSRDMEQLAERFADAVDFVWVNEPSDMLFALKRTLEAGASLALQSDRIEHSTRFEIFDFLGARRRFPFTTYHLAYLYRRPVTFAFGVPEGRDAIAVHSGPVLRFAENIGRAEYLEAARAHFQEVLHIVESILCEQPYQWFNFLPLNPVEEGGK